MKAKTKSNIIGTVGIALFIVLLGWVEYGWASERKPTQTQYQKQDQDQKQLQGQDQDQSQSAVSIASQGQTLTNQINIGADGTPLSTLSTGATSLTDNSNVEFKTENNSSNTVLVPNNNTESCLRVFGLGFPTSNGSVVLGFPWRSGQCDLEAAADDAFAQGQMAMGWMLKCKQKALKKAFGGEGKCLSTAMDGMNLHSELEKLRAQNEQLLELRASDREECDNRVDRANTRTGRCEQKLFEDK